MVKNKRNKSTFYQWDLNQTVLIQHPNINSVVSVHFSNISDRSKNALAVTPTITDGIIYADVPNILLQYPGKIFVYLYCIEDDSMYSVLAGNITILPREKPSDYIYTENDIKTWVELEEKVKEKVNVSDVVDNLDTDDPEKPLSANMGKQIKTLIDNLEAKIGGSLNITDDGDGNITITTSSGISATDDGDENTFFT